MFVLELFLYAIIGVIAGILAGLLGISGGVITVPLLVLLFSLLDFPQTYVMHLAIGTSLASMCFNALSSTWMHNKKGVVLWKVVKRMFPGIVIGSICGSLVAHFLSGVVLEMIFGIFEILLGLYFFRQVKLHEGDHPLPKAGVLNCIGFGVSSLANVLGIGGGLITVPTLMAFRVHEKKAIGTSAATGVIITFLGAIGYMIFGFKQQVSIDQDAIGYLYLPAFLVISVTTFFAAPYGAELTHRLPSKMLRRIFGYALIGTGLLMVLR
jgi:uncharacterized membrane protein YfcA